MGIIGKTIRLSNNVEMPRLGLGVWKIENSKADRAVLWALESGYRLIDTAKVYKNEAGVGKGIIESGLPRKEIFVTTKLAIFDLLKPEKAFEESLQRLKLDYVDLYLIHWPFLGWLEAWKALEKIYKAGLARAIGVSNFGIEQLKEIEKSGAMLPMANEVEITPFLYRKKLINYCQAKGIVVVAYSPLTMGKRLNDLALQNLTNAYKKSTAQILIRWGLQHDLVMIPKSETKAHIQENLKVFDFELEIKDMQKLDALNENHSMMPLWSRG